MTHVCMGVLSVEGPAQPAEVEIAPHRSRRNWRNEDRWDGWVGSTAVSTKDGRRRLDGGGCIQSPYSFGDPY